MRAERVVTHHSTPVITLKAFVRATATSPRHQGQEPDLACVRVLLGQDVDLQVGADPDVQLPPVRHEDVAGGGRGALCECRGPPERPPAPASTAALLATLLANG